MNQLRIRFASTEDQTLCKRLDWRWPGTVEGKIDDREYILAELGGQAIGFLRLEKLWGTIPYVGMIWLAAEHRGRGAGRAILAFLEQDLRANGYKMLLSSSQVNEAEPQAWHRAVGFHECGILAGINEGAIGEVFFRKDL